MRCANVYEEQFAFLVVSKVGLIVNFRCLCVFNIHGIPKLTGQLTCELFSYWAIEKAVNTMVEKRACLDREIYEKLSQYIKEIRYGSIVLVIQDGKVVQIEKNEKVRFI